MRLLQKVIGFKYTHIIVHLLDMNLVLGGDIKQGIVNIHNKTCSYRVFQLNQLVCEYATTACLTVRVDYINLCSNYYSKESLVMAHTQSTESVGDMANWKISAKIWETKVNSSVKAPSPGHRLELIIPPTGEDVKRRTVKHE